MWYVSNSLYFLLSLIQRGLVIDFPCLNLYYSKTMDVLGKENVECQTGHSLKRGKDSAYPLENIKKLKTILKPLCDVKNIIEEKILVHPQKKKANVITECKTISSTSEDSYNEDLFFFSEFEDNYEDIIPKSLQMDEVDISKLATVFVNLPFKEVEKMELLPHFDFGYEMDELCDIIKGIDSNCLLFEDTELNVQL